MLKKQVVDIINKINSLHINDPIISNYWDELTEVLSKNEEETIVLLQTCDDEKYISNISSVFDDLSEIFQSKKFVECLIELEKKYSHLNIHHMVEIAANMIDEES